MRYHRTLGESPFRLQFLILGGGHPHVEAARTQEKRGLELIQFIPILPVLLIGFANLLKASRLITLVIATINVIYWSSCFLLNLMFI